MPWLGSQRIGNRCAIKNRSKPLRAKDHPQSQERCVISSSKLENRGMADRASASPPCGPRRTYEALNDEGGPPRWAARWFCWQARTQIRPCLDRDIYAETRSLVGERYRQCWRLCVNETRCFGELVIRTPSVPGVCDGSSVRRQIGPSIRKMRLVRTLSVTRANAIDCLPEQDFNDARNGP